MQYEEIRIKPTVKNHEKTDEQKPDAGSLKEQPRRSRGRIGFRLMAVLVALLPFVVLEAAFRVFDIGNPNTVDDPLVGFSQLQPLFDLDETKGVYRTARSRELFFGIQEFAAEKPDNGFRVFCLGGSTVRGRPYRTDTAFAKWLEFELSACDESRQYESVNCGGLSYASYRVRVMLDEVLKYQPDLIVIATGHNEFLEDRTYESLKLRSAARAWIEDRVSSLRIVTAARQAWKDDETPAEGSDSGKTDSGKTVLGDTVETRLDDASGYASYHRDDDWRAGVIEHFDVSVRAMIDMCKRAGVPLILLNLGSNLRDTAPFKSEHKPDLSADDEAAWQQAFDDAGRTEVSDPERSLKKYRQAEAIDDEFALLSFRMARCLDQLERYDEAGKYYLKAKDDDICPLRMLDDMYGILNGIAEETKTPIIDVRLLIEKTSANRIPGHDWYTDHVHPTIRAHQRIAQAITQQMRKQSLPQELSDWDDSDRRAAYGRHQAGLSNIYLANGRRQVGWLENWARRNRLFEETLPIDSRGFLHRGFRQFGFGEIGNAWQDFETVLKEDPSRARDLVQYALERFEQGRADSAEALLTRLAQQAAAEPIEVDIDLARLVLAVERGDDAAAAEFYLSNKDELSRQSVQSSPWLAAVPDAVIKAKKLAATVQTDE